LAILTALRVLDGLLPPALPGIAGMPTIPTLFFVLFVISCNSNCVCKARRGVSGNTPGMPLAPNSPVPMLPWLAGEFPRSVIRRSSRFRFWGDLRDRDAAAALPVSFIAACAAAADPLPVVFLPGFWRPLDRLLCSRL
jgi:hypothetical protein